MERTYQSMRTRIIFSIGILLVFLSVKALAMLFSTDIGIEDDPITYTAFCPP